MTEMENFAGSRNVAHILKTWSLLIPKNTHFVKTLLVAHKLKGKNKKFSMVQHIPTPIMAVMATRAFKILSFTENRFEKLFSISPPW
jgi:hypothetical protein